MRTPTFGVEEEFLLLDPASGRPRPSAPALLRLLRGQPGPRAELMRFQIETATAVCYEAAGLRGELVRLRRSTTAAARTLGCRLVATGSSPYGLPGLGALTDRPRYRELARRYPALTAAATCGCHVHVGVATREVGVQVLARLRPWLAPLLSLSANSPLDSDRDTGSASHRYAVVTRWPTARPPGVWADAAAYDRVVRRLIRRGAAIDEGSVYLFARLSPRFPTVEVRIADVCPDVDTALLLALLVRALVATATTEARAGRSVPQAAGRFVWAGLAQAARSGLTGAGIDPFTGRPIDPWELVYRLVDHVSAALDTLGDRGAVYDRLAMLHSGGTGAERQRAAWRRARGPADLVAALAAMTAAEPLGPERAAVGPERAVGGPERRAVGLSGRTAVGPERTAEAAGRIGPAAGWRSTAGGAAGTFGPARPAPAVGG